MPADFPWTPIALVVVAIIGYLGVRFGIRGDKAVLKAQHDQNNRDQLQQDYDRSIARRDRAESWAETLEDYAGDLRLQVIDLKGTPKPWPAREKP